MSDDTYISTRATMARLGRTERQVRRYASEGKLRSRKRGNRVDYLASDVEALASELKQDERPSAPAVDILPAGEMLRYVQQLNAEIAAAAAREGALRAMLDQRPRLEDHQQIQQELASERQRRETLEHELAQTQQQVHQQRRGTRLAMAALVILLVIVAVLVVLLFVR